MVFHYLPEALRVECVRRVLGPSGGALIKDKVVGRVPLHLGYSPQKASFQDDRVLLRLVAEDGTERTITAEHIIAATGYKVDVERLQFLSSNTRSKIKNLDGAPILSSTFESSVPGLYFVGIAAANSFGPVMRFAFGARFAARTVTKAVAKSLAPDSAAVAGRSPVATTK
jgi:thioredoxin reductase